MSDRTTAAAIFVLGACVGLAGDACHVASHTTHYEWDGVPVIWRSAIWFAQVARWRHPAPVHARRARDLPAGAAAVLAIYAFTALLKGQPDTISALVTPALGVVVWHWWDPSPGAALAGALAALV